MTAATSRDHPRDPITSYWPDLRSAVCRLTPLSPEEVADLKLAITEAANDYVDESRGLEDESRLNFSFHLGDDRLLMDLDGTAGPVAASEQELSRAIIEATVDQAEFGDGHAPCEVPKQTG